MTIDEAISIIAEGKSDIISQLMLNGMKRGEFHGIFLFVDKGMRIRYLFSITGNSFFPFRLVETHTDLIEKGSNEWNKLLNFLETLIEVKRM